MSVVHADPFGPTADPDLYVPRAATEHALERLVVSLRRGALVTILAGPPGIGKTLLLRVLASRLQHEFEFANAPYPALPASDLCAWVLRELGEMNHEEPERALQQRAARSGDAGRPLVLTIDDASSMPQATAADLRRLTTSARGSLRLVAVLAHGPGSDGVPRALDPDGDRIRLDAPMSAEETAEYVAARLAAAHSGPELLARFDQDTLARLHRESQGVPGRLHHGATAVVRGGHPDSGGTAPAPRPPVGDAPAPRRRAALANRLERPAPVPRRASESEPLLHRAPPTRRSRSWRILVAGAVLVLALASVWRLIEQPPEGREPTGASHARAPAAAAPTSPARGDRPLGAPGDARDPRVRVNVNATPWAEIEIDGEPFGVTPLGGVLLHPGRHRVRARMPDGRVVERVADIGPTLRHLVFE